MLKSFLAQTHQVCIHCKWFLLLPISSKPSNWIM